MISDSLLSIRTILLGEEDWIFLAEVILRSFVMFIVAFVSLRIIGKRGPKQGVFDLVLIITLGSAAGDPAFYSKVGLLPSILVFAVVIGMYKVMDYLIANSRFSAGILEGKAVNLVKNGVFQKQNFRKGVTLQEFLSDLRQAGVSQLGQLSLVIVESSGKLSIYFFEPDQVRPGLPILLEAESSTTNTLLINQLYACNACGTTAQFTQGGKQHCPNCAGDSWVPIKQSEP